jgi:hypothetical protein
MMHDCILDSIKYGANCRLRALLEGSSIVFVKNAKSARDKPDFLTRADVHPPVLCPKIEGRGHAFIESID